MQVYPLYLLNVVLTKEPDTYNVICCTRNSYEGKPRKVLHLQFDDLTREYVEKSKELKKQVTHGKYILPHKTHVNNSLVFARYHGLEKLIVACDAGISRSSAIAWSILYDQYRNFKRATELLFNLNSVFVPNRDIIRLALSLVNIGHTYEEVDQCLKQRESYFKPG